MYEIIKQLLIQIKQLLIDLPARLKIATQQITVTSLSDLSETLGLVKAGEFRAGNNKEPGNGFTGMRMGYPSFTYNGSEYNFAGVENDSLQTGFSSTDSKFIFANGNAYIDADGITGNDLLKQLLKQNATVGTDTRYWKLGFRSVDSLPLAEWEYWNSAGVEQLLNGGFETGDFTNWTKTTETGESWNINSDPSLVRTGSYALVFPLNMGGTGAQTETGVLTSDRVAVTAGNNYLISAWLKIAYFLAVGAGCTNTTKIEINWYDHASAGSLISTDTLMTMTVAGDQSYTEYSNSFIAPTGALSLAIVITVTGTKPATTATALTITACFDDISVIASDPPIRFALTDYGASTSKGLYSDTVEMFFDNMTATDAESGAITIDAAQRYAFYYQSGGSSANDGSYYTFPDIPLRKGTYSLSLLGYVNTGNAIVDIYIDGVEVASQDWYNGSAVKNTTKTSASLAVGYHGLHTIMFKIDGDNASANGAHYLRATKFWMWRTGD